MGKRGRDVRGVVGLNCLWPVTLPLAGLWLPLSNPEDVRKQAPRQTFSLTPVHVYRHPTPKVRVLPAWLLGSSTMAAFQELAVVCRSCAIGLSRGMELFGLEWGGLYP